MSQFCGSFTAFSNRSLLTVILYCAAVWDVASMVIDTPAIAAQAMVTSLRLRCCMTAPPLKPPVRCGRLRIIESTPSYFVDDSKYLRSGGGWSLAVGMIVPSALLKYVWLPTLRMPSLSQLSSGQSGYLS